MQKFYEKKQKIFLKDVLNFFSIKNEALNENLEIQEISPIEKAQEGHLTFLTQHALSGDKYIDIVKESKASVCLTDKKNLSKLPREIIAIEVDNAYVSFIELYEHFYKEIEFEKIISPKSIIHPTASISDKCQIEEGAVIGANVTIENYVKIGKNTIINSNSSLRFCTIGQNSHIGFGARIGQDGFGFIPQKKNDITFVFKIPHFGGVEIGENCSIGANTCIDRGNFDNTKIGSFTKIDNLCQIAHNCQIGNGVMMAGQAGLAGSCKIGNNVLMGAKAGVVGHVKIGDNSVIYAGSGVTKTFPENSKIFAGWPAELYEAWIRKLILLNSAYKKAVKIKNLIEKSDSKKAKILRFIIKWIS
jgi:UDP-3-O-[3-hydroxymyristoyl] glucosamine N-acyltransferase